MSCESTRTYIIPPDASLVSLPSVPQNPNNWNAIVDFLEEVKKIIENPEGEVPTPGPVPNFALEVMTGGVALTWDSAPNVSTTASPTSAYILYRGETNDWTKSKAVVTPHSKTRFQFRWFDKWGQAPSGTMRFYWVQALTQRNIRSIVDFVRGPLTGPLTTVEP
jgi:hypothetical protein